MDGDLDLPTLVGIGTEDYIGTGWGQGEYQGQYFGSLVSDNENDLYAFYRYHIKDAVYFHQDCKVTIQQMGNAPQEKLKDMITKKAELEPVWAFDMKGATDIVNIKGERPEHIHILDLAKKPDPFSNTYPKGGTNFYRRDDVSATAYFYLDNPQSNLPELPPVELRLQDMQEKVYDKKLKK